jgi:hypothetical protein
MITRIEIDNFMAHERLLLDLGPGMTVITGPNNTGKSAIVEALRCVAENPPAAPFIRHGAKEARVTLTLRDDDGEWRIVWIRVKGHARYELYLPDAQEPEVYAKFGTTPPEDILRRLRLNLVGEERAKALDVHLGDQRKPVFLLDAPGSAAAQFFAASTESAHLLAMQDLLKARTAAAERDRKAAEQNQRSLELGLQRLAPLPDVELRILAAQDLLEHLRNLENQIPDLERTARSIRTQRSHAASLLSRASVLERLPPLPRLCDVAPLARLLLEHARAAAGRRLEQGRLVALKKLAPVPSLYDTGQLAGLLQRLVQGRHRHGLLHRGQEGLAHLHPAPALFDSRALGTSISRLREVRDALRAARMHEAALRPLQELPALFPLDPLLGTRARQQKLLHARECTRLSLHALERLAPAPELTDTAPLLRMLRDLRQMRSRCEEQRAAEVQCDKALADWRGVAEARIKKLGVCPTCGGSLDLNTLLSTGHTHG